MQCEQVMQATSPYTVSRKAHGGYHDVTPAQAYAARGAVRLVDVREPYEFNDELGHIPGAELVPLGSLAAHARSWDRNADIIVVCRSGGRSGRAALALVGAGFRRVMNLAGGMSAYNAAALPVERA